MSSVKNKKTVAVLPLRLTEEVRDALDSLAEKHQRTKQGMVFWLITEFYKGNIEDVQKIVTGTEKAILAALSRLGYLPEGTKGVPISPETRPIKEHHIGSVSGVSSPDEQAKKQGSL